MNNQDPQTAIDYNLYPSTARPSGLQVPQSPADSDLTNQLEAERNKVKLLAMGQETFLQQIESLKSELTAHTQALKVVKEALNAAEGLISRANPRAFDNGVIIQDAALVLKIYDQIKQAIAAINNLLK